MENSILFRTSSDSEFQIFIGIGGCDIDPQDPEQYILPDDCSINGWIEFLKNEESIIQIVALNYVLISEGIENYLPQELQYNCLKNKEVIEEIISRWFVPDSSLFKFLDLTDLYISEEQEDSIELNESETKYNFKDGTSLIINEGETSIFQYFIPIEKLEILRKDNILLKQLLI